MQGMLLMATMVLFVLGVASLLAYTIAPDKRSSSRDRKPSLAKSRSGSGGGGSSNRSSSSSRYRDDDCGGGFLGGGGDSGSCGGDGGGGGGD